LTDTVYSNTTLRHDLYLKSEPWGTKTKPKTTAMGKKPQMAFWNQV